MSFHELPGGMFTQTWLHHCAAWFFLVLPWDRTGLNPAAGEMCLHGETQSSEKLGVFSKFGIQSVVQHVQLAAVDPPGLSLSQLL
jgi:hypothetical protein